MEKAAVAVLFFGRRSMPMMRSTTADDDDAIGPNSRYMSVVNASIAHQRRCQIIQDLDARMTRMKLQVMEKNAIVQDQRYKRMQRRLQGNLERNLAYKLVVGEHRILGTDDYQGALNANYSYNSFKPEVLRMMERLKPSYIREQKAKLQLQRSKKAQAMIIERSLNHPSLQTVQSERERLEREKGRPHGGDDPLQNTPRGRDGDIVPSSGGFLLNRWATTFGGKTPTSETTPTLPDKAITSVANAQPVTSVEGTGGKFFKRTGGVLGGKPQLANTSPRAKSRRKLGPLKTQSLDGKSLLSPRSEKKPMIKTMSVDGDHAKRIATEEISGVEENSHGLLENTKKKRKRYTLPPVKVQKSIVRR